MLDKFRMNYNQQ